MSPSRRTRPAARILPALLVLALCTHGLAAVAPAWKASLDGEVLWHAVTSLGNVVVATKAALIGVDAESGSVVWKLGDLGGLSREGYQEIPQSPLVKVTRGDGSLVIVEPFEGRIVFDSKKAGVKQITGEYMLYQAGALMLVTPEAAKHKVVMVDMAGGSVLWDKGAMDKVVAVHELSADEFLLVTLFNIFRLKTHGGEEVWKTVTSKEVAQLQAMGGALAGLVKKMAENASAGANFEIRFYTAPSGEYFYIGSENEQKQQTSSGGTAVSYKNTYQAFKLSDGSLVWPNAVECAGKFGQVAFTDKGMIVMTDNGSRSKIHLIDYRSGKTVWGKKGRGLTVKGGVKDFVWTKSGIVFMSGKYDDGYINILDPATGTLKFEDPVRTSGKIVRVEELPKGLLYVTEEEVNIVSLATGETLLEDEVETGPNLNAAKGKKLFVFSPDDDALFVIDRDAAVAKQFSREDVEFEGKESATGVEVRQKGVVVTSEQNIIMLKPDGSIAFQKYYPAPREPGLKRALLIAQGVRAAYIASVATVASTQFAVASKKADNEGGKVMGAAVSQAYGSLAQAGGAYAKKAFTQAAARFKATMQTRDFIMMLTEGDDGNLLAKVNKDTGEIAASINLGKDKAPKYEVDDVTGRVYYCPGGGELQCYQL